MIIMICFLSHFRPFYHDGHDYDDDGHHGRLTLCSVFSCLAAFPRPSAVKLDQGSGKITVMVMKVMVVMVTVGK